MFGVIEYTHAKYTLKTLPWQPNFEKNNENCTDFSYTQKYNNFGFIRLQLRYQCLKQQKSMLKTYQFKTQCKDDISHASETAKN